MFFSENASASDEDDRFTDLLQNEVMVSGDVIHYKRFFPVLGITVEKDLIVRILFKVPSLPSLADQCMLLDPIRPSKRT